MSEPKAAAPRLASLDQFRGYTVLGMVFVNFIGGFTAFHLLPFLPVFRHHNTYCSYADTIMPQFLFAVGFAYRLTFLRRMKEGGYGAAAWHAVRRNFGLILLGIVYYHLEGSVRTWDELQQLGAGGVLRQAFQRRPFETLVHIGVTSLWVLPVIAAAPWLRIAFMLFSTGLSLLLWHEGYYRWLIGQLGLDYEQARQAVAIFPYYPWVMARPGIDGGPLGFMTWTIPLLVGSLAFDAVAAAPPSAGHGSGRLIRRLLAWGVVLMVLGYAVSCVNRVSPPNDGSWGQGIGSLLATPPFMAPPEGTVNLWTMSQRAGSVSYLTFAAGFSLAVYALFVAVSDVGGYQLGIFRTLGSNALAAYLIAGLVGRAVFDYAPKDAPLWYVLSAFAVDLAVICLFCRHLEKNRLFLRL